MQALERSFLTNDWLTLVLLFLILLIFVLRGLQQEKLQGYFLVFFNKGFVDTEVEERITIFNSYYVLQFLFTVTVIALSVFKISDFYYDFEKPPTTFLLINLGTLVYFVAKKALEFSISNVLQIQDGLKCYLISKSSYLYSSAYYFLAYLILFVYAKLPFNVLLFLMGSTLIIRFALIISYNKNLIFNHLFYFILYLCAFEIAPLLILFKLML